MDIFQIIEEISMESVRNKLYDKIEKVSGISIPQDLRDYLDDYSKNVYKDPKFDGVDIVPLNESSKYNIFTEIKYFKFFNIFPNFNPAPKTRKANGVAIFDISPIALYTGFGIFIFNTKKTIAVNVAIIRGFLNTCLINLTLFTSLPE